MVTINRRLNGSTPLMNGDNDILIRTVYPHKEFTEGYIPESIIKIPDLKIDQEILQKNLPEVEKTNGIAPISEELNIPNSVKLEIEKEKSAEQILDKKIDLPLNGEPEITIKKEEKIKKKNLFDQLVDFIYNFIK
jgi:hypothetical protein